MKQYIILIVAISLILILNFWQFSFLKETSQYLLSDVWAIKNSVAREDWNSAKKEVIELKNTWENVKFAWDIFGEHDDIEQITGAIVSLNVYIANEEKIDSINEYTILGERINNVIATERFSFENVF